MFFVLIAVIVAATLVLLFLMRRARTDRTIEAARRPLPTSTQDRESQKQRPVSEREPPDANTDRAPDRPSKTADCPIALHALPINPTMIYLYWEKNKQPLDETRLQLNVRDADTGTIWWSAAVDIEGSYFLRDLPPHHAFQIELGPEKGGQPIARVQAHTPAATPSSIIDPDWAPLWEEETPFYQPYHTSSWHIDESFGNHA
ncbi:MAG: hypothetical protein IMW91_05745 [Firmicutes bacterium]|nr:hypothetical protein [Bacillota bacterium]